MRPNPLKKSQEPKSHFFFLLVFQAEVTLETSHIGKGCDRDTYNLASQRQLCGASDLAIDLLPDPQQVRLSPYHPFFFFFFPFWINPFIIVVYSLEVNGQLAYNVTKASPMMPVWLVLMGKLELVFPSLWCHRIPFLTINSPLPHGCDIVITKHWKNTSRNISFVKLMIIVSILLDIYYEDTPFFTGNFDTPTVFVKLPKKSHFTTLLAKRATFVVNSNDTFLEIFNTVMP